MFPAITIGIIKLPQGMPEGSTVSGYLALYTWQMRTPMLPEDYQYHQEGAGQCLLTRKPGRMWARASLIFGVWPLFIAPAVCAEFLAYGRQKVRAYRPVVVGLR